MFKNAGINSKEEARIRLENGEKFHFRNGTQKFVLHYDSTKAFAGKSPYRADSERFGADNLNDLWHRYLEWEVECSWHEDIPSNGILCWVHDDTPDIKDDIRLILRYDEYRGSHKFRSKYAGWKYATPVKQGEIGALDV